MDENSARFYLLRRKAESSMTMGGRAPWTFVSILRIRNASLSRANESLVFGQRAGGTRQLRVKRDAFSGRTAP